MNQLHIYPTSRALRSVSESLREQEGFLPTLMRMDEFENRTVLIENRTQIDPLARILLLREAAKFERFETLKVDRDMVRFFTKSDALFKFFEELAGEKVSFASLAEADAYAEFSTHIEILERLFKNYVKLLEEGGYTDKSLIPAMYALNKGFIQNYERIEVHLEGYLSRFELELLEKVSNLVPLQVHYTTTPFTGKMEERFLELGLSLPKNKSLSIDFSHKSISRASANSIQMKVEVLSVEERNEQVALAFEKIEALVQQGIAAEKIALVLPDESMKNIFSLYDRHNNLNFAMGLDYAESYAYQKLDSLWEYWKHFNAESRYRMERFGLVQESYEAIAPTEIMGIEDFFTLLMKHGLLDIPMKEISKRVTEAQKEVYEHYLYFSHTFRQTELRVKEWLYLWLKRLSRVTIDDIGGGKVTVMGVLETRGASFDAVVIVDFNDGIVPAASGKDQFLNSSVRAYAGLPTKSDREALQKQYYLRLLGQSESAVVMYSKSDNRLPSKFLYELGLDEATQTAASLPLLYSEASRLVEESDPVVEKFDAANITWSASRLKTWLECKRKYYYRYIEKIEPKPEETLIEGVLLHTLLEYLFQDQDRFGTTEEMREMLNRSMDRLLPEQDAATLYRKMLWKEKLKGFVETQVAHFNAGWCVVEREKEFSGEIGGLQFKGRIDRLDQNGTHSLMLDYKSGSTTEAQKSRNIESLKDFQMSIYSRLLSSTYPKMTLAFVKLFEGGKMEEITLLEEKNALLAETINTLKQTRSFVAEKCATLSLCTYCEFALMCERGEYL